MIIKTDKLTPLHGFCEKHGTIEQLNRITNEIIKAFQQREHCSAIFLDVAQAIDNVWHEGLLHKIKKLPLSNFHRIFNSNHSDKRFTVKVNDYTTEDFPIKAGVPQDSVLGPTLYLIFTSDIPASSFMLTSTFADDTVPVINGDTHPQKCPAHGLTRRKN